MCFLFAIVLMHLIVINVFNTYLPFFLLLFFNINKIEEVGLIILKMTNFDLKEITDRICQKICRAKKNFIHVSFCFRHMVLFIRNILRNLRKTINSFKF